MSNYPKLTDPTEIYVERYSEFQAILEEHEKAHWVKEEADMRIDIEQWKDGTITDREKEFIKMILRLFTQSDTNVCTAYIDRLLPIFKNADARMMLISFANREVTHILGYKRLNDTLGLDSEEFMSEFLEYSEMAEKHKFMIEEFDPSTPTGVAEYLARQILMEGVNLFASFEMLLNYSRVGLLQGMVSVNKWSIVDESLHVRGLIALFRIYIEEHPEVVTDKFKQKIYETARTVIKLEDDFVDLCYSIGDSRGLAKEEVKEYIRFVADFRMISMGFKGQFNIEKHPSPWIDEITGNTIGNFFEAPVVEYSKDNLVGEYTY